MKEVLGVSLWLGQGRALNPQAKGAASFQSGISHIKAWDPSAMA